MNEKSTTTIVILIIAFILITWLNEKYINEKWHERLEEKSFEVHCKIQEMRKEIINLADENLYFLEHYDEYSIDDIHFSGSFEEVLNDFEHDIERIW